MSTPTPEQLRQIPGLDMFAANCEGDSHRRKVMRKAMCEMINDKDLTAREHEIYRKHLVKCGVTPPEIELLMAKRIEDDAKLDKFFQKE